MHSGYEQRSIKTVNPSIVKSFIDKFSFDMFVHLMKCSLAFIRMLSSIKHVGSTIYRLSAVREEMYLDRTIIVSGLNFVSDITIFCTLVKWLNCLTKVLIYKMFSLQLAKLIEATSFLVSKRAANIFTIINR
jgi:hypothetical protein